MVDSLTTLIVLGLSAVIVRAIGPICRYSGPIDIAAHMLKWYGVFVSLRMVALWSGVPGDLYFQESAAFLGAWWICVSVLLFRKDCSPAEGLLEKLATATRTAHTSDVSDADRQLATETLDLALEGWQAGGEATEPFAELSHTSGTVHQFGPAMQDFRDINALASDLWSRCQEGKLAYFRFQSLNDRWSRAASGGVMGRLGYLIGTILKRIPSKLPFFRPLVLLVTAGRNQWISTVEMTGRFYYCGWDTVMTRHFAGTTILCFKRSSREPMNTSPSLYPVIALTRVGFRGRKIRSYKLRSMYPYSEFLQAQVYASNQLSGSGKMLDDPRITSYGRFIRRYWLDELPQVMNWLRNDIKIVGIRAMSAHYFSLYPERYQRKFIATKPGFLSPLFDDSNPGFEAIVETEEAYLDLYARSPVRADLVYLFKTVDAILFKGVRSG